MNKYLGVKIVSAVAMSLGDYNKHRGWEIPADEDPTVEGYLVVYPDGYQSWCPREQFETANQPIDGLSFGHAIEAARVYGKRLPVKAGMVKGCLWCTKRAILKGFPVTPKQPKRLAYRKENRLKYNPTFKCTVPMVLTRCGLLPNRIF